MASGATLDAVTRSKGAYALAKSTLEARLRDELKEQLRKLNSQLDIAIRYAYDDGHSKAEILRALGTRDFYTLKHSLDRTENVVELKGVSPLDSVYSYADITELLTVNYVAHGPSEISGFAVFKYKKMEDGSRWLFSETPLYTEDYSVRNKAVGVLDQKQDGYYYDEAMRWLDEKL